MSDISQDENPFDQNNNNNEKDTDTKDNQMGVIGDVQNSSGSYNPLVDPSPPRPLDDTAPDSLGDPSSNAAVSGSAASRGPAGGTPASGTPASGIPGLACWETRTAWGRMLIRPCIARLRV